MEIGHVERWHHVDFSKQKSVVKKQPFWSLETEKFLSMAQNPLFLQGGRAFRRSPEPLLACPLQYR
jgi:hypothetical protein